jgi:ferritin-like metal-binding protein YciE
MPPETVLRPAGAGAGHRRRPEAGSGASADTALAAPPRSGSPAKQPGGASGEEPLAASAVVQTVPIQYQARRDTMAIASMEDLFVETLKDIYYAEKQILKALPAMAKKAHEEELKQAFEHHRQETENHVKRLEQVFEQLDMPARGKKIEDDEVLDAGMIGAAQTVEHYEICRYGTLVEWAKQLGHEQAMKLLEENLSEEKKTDKLLTEIAERSINQRAAAAA